MFVIVAMVTAYTAQHSLDHGFRTIVVDDACKGVNAVNIASTKKSLTSRHAAIVNSSQVRT